MKKNLNRTTNLLSGPSWQQTEKDLKGIKKNFNKTSNPPLGRCFCHHWKPKHQWAPEFAQAIRVTKGAVSVQKNGDQLRGITPPQWQQTAALLHHRRIKNGHWRADKSAAATSRLAALSSGLSLLIFSFFFERSYRHRRSTPATAAAELHYLARTTPITLLHDSLFIVASLTKHRNIPGERVISALTPAATSCLAKK
uniref:RNase H type-1 domain-containing protein n=1 Tax=Steinernema glaseri TaxID=37863 RepID=A0A1I7YW79_9BILA